MIISALSFFATKAFELNTHVLFVHVSSLPAPAKPLLKCLPFVTVKTFLSFHTLYICAKSSLTL